MSKHLRTAIEQIKQFYIKKLVESDLAKETSRPLTELTVSELETIYRSRYPLVMKKTSKTNQNISKTNNNVRKYNTIC
jgi:hypothetical protein